MILTWSALFTLLACTGDTGGDTGDGPAGLAVLGQDTHSLDAVAVDVLATEEDGLALPRDLEFHPETGDLWVVNQYDNNVTVLAEPGTESQDTQTIGSYNVGRHFLAQPSALAFGDDGAFATSHEEDEKTQGPTGTDEDFMGPTLWTWELDDFDGGHGGHLDMLHNSPNAVGIAWETDNKYWVYDGWNTAITSYDFNGDHDLGGSDHSDGEIYRYVEGEVGYVSDVGSHLVFDPSTDLLYIADTGNNRIAVLDTSTGEKGGRISPNYDGADQYSYDGATLTTLVDGSEHGLEQPSGLELADGMLWLSDHATGRIAAFELDGTLVDYLDTGWTERIMGLAVQDGQVWVVDTTEQEVVRIAAQGG